MRGYAGLSGIVDDATASWDAAVSDFREKENQLNAAERQLLDAAPQAQQDPDDAAEWRRLMNRILAMQSTLETMHAAIDTGVRWWDAAVGGTADVMEKTADWWTSFKKQIPGLSGLHQIGAIQVALPISLGALAAAAATMAAIAASVAGFITYLSMKGADLSNLDSDVTQLRDAGASEPEIQTYVRDRTRAASKSAQEKASYSLTGDLSKIAMWIGLGLLAVFVLPQVMKMLPGKK